jgi:phage tail sheath gpL-like
MQNSDMPPCELAANNAAVYSLFEATPLTAVGGLNFDAFGNDAVSQASWFVPAPLSGTSPSRTSIKSALLNGITPLAVQNHGTTSISKRITTRSLNGAVNDYRIRDSHKVTICDYFADDLYARAVLQFARMAIGNDPAKGQRPPGPGVVTPSSFKAMLVQLINEYNNDNLLQNVTAIIGATQVQREVSPSTRITARVPLQPVDILDQIGVNIDQA